MAVRVFRGRGSRGTSQRQRAQQRGSLLSQGAQKGVAGCASGM